MKVRFYTNNKLCERITGHENSEQISLLYKNLLNYNKKINNNILRNQLFYYDTIKFLNWVDSRYYNYTSDITVEIIILNCNIGIAKNNKILDGLTLYYNNKYVILLKIDNANYNRSILLHELTHVIYDLLKPYENNFLKVEKGVEEWTEEIIKYII